MNDIWEHSAATLRRSDGFTVPHPSASVTGRTTYENDWKSHNEDISNYFVVSLGVDGSVIRKYRSIEAYQHSVASRIRHTKAQMDSVFVITLTATFFK